MAHFEQLEPDQRIVLRMAIRRRRSYAVMAEALGSTPDEIRGRALDALDALVPERPVGLSDDDRVRAGDYLLGQLDGPAQDATARLLAPSGPARTWALLVQERLSDLGEPAVPVPDEVAAAPAARKAAVASRRVLPALRRVLPALRRALPALRRVLATVRGRVAAGAVALVLLLVVLLATGVFGGDGGDEDAILPEATQNQALAVQFAALLPQTIEFRPPADAPAEFASATGVARPTVSSGDASVPVLALEIQGLPPAAETRRYFVWADRNGEDPVLLGELPDVAGAQLPFQGIDVGTGQPVIVDPSVYNRIRITRETSASPTGPGETVLVATITPRAAE